jgi:glycosyltransferase involved in cell wall biosynthesis
LLQGTLIAESLRIGTTLDAVPLVVRKIARHEPTDVTSDQPTRWTNIEFEVEDADAEALADALSEILDEPGWYADFRSQADTFVIYHGRIFRYPRGEAAGRAEAKEHGRRLGVPEEQLDWPI